MIKTIIKTFIYTFIFSLLLIIAALWLIPSSISSDNIKSSLSRLVSEHFGKELKINGIASFSILPNIALTFDNAVISFDDNKKSDVSIKKFNIIISSSEFFFNNLDIKLSIITDTENYSAKLFIPNIKEISTGSYVPVDIAMTSPVTAHLSGKVSLSENVASLKEAIINTPSIDGSVDITVKDKDGVTHIVGDLNFKKLDVTAIQTIISAISPEKKSNYENDDVQLEELLAEKKPATGISIWSEKPFDFSKLKTLDIDISFKADSIITPTSVFGKTKADLRITEGKTTFVLEKSEMYDGTGEGTVILDTSSDTPHIQNEFSFKNIEIGNILKDVGDINILGGNGAFEISISSEGNNELEIIKNLSGKSSISITDGVIRGIDLLAIKQSSNVSIQKRTDKTKILNLSATFNIKNGIVSNDDLYMKIPFATLNGIGNLNAADLFVKYRLTPSMGVGGFGMRIPLIIRGDIRSPKILPDAKGIIIKNVDQLNILDNKVIRKVGDDFEKFGKAIGGTLIKGLLGNPDK